jgi:hypothetical protein
VGNSKQKKPEDPLLTRFGPSSWTKQSPHYVVPPLPFTGPEPTHMVVFHQLQDFLINFGHLNYKEELYGGLIDMHQKLWMRSKGERGED